MKPFVKPILSVVLLAALFSACSNKKSDPAPEVQEPEGTPPKTWKEHWGDHDHLTLHRVFYDDNVAIYFDDDMNPAITWPNTLIAKVWAYTKKTYGDFGADPRLYAIFHGYEYSGGHPAGYFDPSHDYRNAIDMGGSKGGLNAWFNDEFNNYGIPIHETGHVVEGDCKGVNGSPAFGIWGDSKWCEIFTYDVYLGLGMETEAATVYDIYMDTNDTYPRSGTYWFRDWFYPIYSQHGKTEVLNKYFELLAKYFPKELDAITNVTKYSRDMNEGEFIHFWSGAAGVNLKPLAENAFGWPYEYEAQFNKAREDFPDITYSDPE